MTAARALLAGIVDYAGLFPPAALSMSDAVARYMAYRAGPDAWMLGRFVTPAGRLDEFVAALPSTPEPDGGALRLSAVLGADARQDGEVIARHNAAYGRRALVDSVEARAADPAAVARVVQAVPPGVELFVEIPVAADLDPMLRAVRTAAARAKIRTGGTTPDAFPSSAEVLRFIRACVSAGVPFKATAGLHHPLRGSYRLTYEANSPSGEMFGYLNLFLAAMFIREGMPDADALALLSEGDPAAFTFDDDGVAWRNRRVSADAISRARTEVALSFGSCSFREPVDELSVLHAER